MSVSILGSAVQLVFKNRSATSLIRCRKSDKGRERTATSVDGRRGLTGVPRKLTGASSSWVLGGSARSGFVQQPRSLRFRRWRNRRYCLRFANARGKSACAPSYSETAFASVAAGGLAAVPQPRQRRCALPRPASQAKSRVNHDGALKPCSALSMRYRVPVVV